MIAEKWDLSREADGGVRRRVATSGRSAPARRDASRPRSRRSTARTSTRARASRTGRRSARCRRSSEAVGSPPRCASQISDGSAALLIANDAALKTHGLTPRARIHHLSVLRRRPDHDAVGADPGHQARAGEDRHDRRRHRPRRDQRGVRLGRAGVARRRPTSTWPRSTSTAGRSPSATRSAPPAPG